MDQKAICLILNAHEAKAKQAVITANRKSARLVKKLDYFTPELQDAMNQASALARVYGAIANMNHGDNCKCP